LLNLENKGSVFILLSVGEGIKHLLGKRSSLVASRVFLLGSYFLNRCLIVLLKALLVLVESEVFSLVVSVIFLLARLVVGNVDVLESSSLLLSESLSDVALNFFFVLTLNSVSVVGL